MTDVAVLLPVLGRPARVEPLLDSLYESAPQHKLWPMFLCSPGDDAQIAAASTPRALCVVVEWEPGPGDYARKMNRGVGIADSGLDLEWVFLAADDVRFHPGWLDAALACHAATGACVVGTNDLGNPAVMHREHSTHTLVSTRYRECGTIDEPDSGKLLHEGYDHNFVDNELIGTAMSRETYAQALDSHVEHLHPAWSKAVQDATYAKGQQRFADDRALFNTRRRLWERP